MENKPTRRTAVWPVYVALAILIIFGVIFVWEVIEFRDRKSVV